MAVCVRLREVEGEGSIYDVCVSFKFYDAYPLLVMAETGTTFDGGLV